jgi:hypothetical protein
LNLSEIRHLHEAPRVVAAWRRLFGPLLARLGPERRRRLLGITALVLVVRFSVKAASPGPRWLDNVPHWTSWLPVAALVLAYVAACYVAAQRFASLPALVRRRPLVVLHATFWLLLLALWNAGQAGPALRAVLTSFAGAIPMLIWRLSYMLQGAQRGRMAGTGFLDHALYIWPAWGGTSTPYGKGLDYLSSTEARDEESLARSQLAGLKLLFLALLWAAGHRVINGLVFGTPNIVQRTLGGFTLGLPTIDEILAGPPGLHPPWVGWIAIYGDLFVQVLKLAATGHVIVGYLRLFGFNVFRNTYKPLLAETVVEFWNRFYYYFKELLVHFFFIPTFVRYFKRSPNLRLLAAVFAAAFVGNLYYHVLLQEPLLRQDWPALKAMLFPRAMYCFLLAAGIYLSMLRDQRGRRSGPGRPWVRRIVAILGVWTFFAVIRLCLHGESTMTERLDHLLSFVAVSAG